MAKKSKVGRPKLPKGESRVELVNVRFKPDERRRLEAAAAGANEKLSQWARRVLLEAVGH